MNYYHSLNCFLVHSNLWSSCLNWVVKFGNRILNSTLGVVNTANLGLMNSNTLLGSESRTSKYKCSILKIKNNTLIPLFIH